MGTGDGPRLRGPYEETASCGRFCLTASPQSLAAVDLSLQGLPPDSTVLWHAAPAFRAVTSDGRNTTGVWGSHSLGGQELKAAGLWLFEHSGTMSVRVRGVEPPSAKEVKEGIDAIGKLHTIGADGLYDFGPVGAVWDALPSRSGSTIGGSRISHQVETGVVFTQKDRERFETTSFDWTVRSECQEQLGDGVFVGCGVVVHGSLKDVDIGGTFNPFTEARASFGASVSRGGAHLSAGASIVGGLETSARTLKNLAGIDAPFIPDLLWQGKVYVGFGVALKAESHGGCSTCGGGVTIKPKVVVGYDIAF